MLKQAISNRRRRNFMVKVMTSPRHFFNALLVLLAYLLRLKKVPGQPVVLDVEPVNACNFKCPHCPVTYTDVAEKHLSPDEFVTVINKFPYALRIKLQGMGEPFLNKSITKLIEQACLKDVWCEVITNGSALDVKKLGAIEQFKNFQLTVSIDAAEEAIFEKIRPGSNFKDIIGNIRNITAYSKLDVAAWMVVSEDNKDQVEDVVKLLAGINIHTLGLQMVVVDYGKKLLRAKTVGKRLRHENLGIYLRSLRECAKQNDVRVNISERFYNKGYLCPWPWMGAFVDVSGNVIPCCRIGDASIYNMGNINETGFDTIWNSPAYRDFRLRHKKNDIPEVCKSCYM